MSQYLVLTAVGPDRPGIVDELSHYLAQRDGNIEDSRMAVLGGEFAAMLLVSGSEKSIAKINADLASLQDSAELTILLKPTAAPDRKRTAKTVPYTAVAVALDDKGLVHQIAHVLAVEGVNVESLQTATEAAPVSGAPIFSMHMALSVPAEMPISHLRQRLAQLAEELNIDITLTPKT